MAGVESVFFAEWLATGMARNQLPISAACNCRCVFCSNDQNPFAITRNIVRGVEDIKHQLSLMPVHDEPIRMSDSLPGRISEGEALLHPRLFDILELVRRRYPFNTLCFTSNGSMLDEELVARLARYRPIEVTLSLHTLRPAVWARIFGRSEAEARCAMAAPALLRRHGIDLAGTIVTTPELCGWEDIEHTYAHLVAQGARAMTLYQPGYTDATAPSVVQSVACPLDRFTELGIRLRQRFPVPLVMHPDMSARLAVAVETIMDRTLRGNPKNGWASFRQVLWLASQAAAARLQQEVAEHSASFPNRHRVVAVENRTYGGNIMVSGLLMTDDFIAAGRTNLAQWPDTELILIPSRPFDALNRDLRYTPAHRIGDELDRTVWLVSDAAEISPLLDRLFQRRQPGDGDGTG